jgi:hypothetical protein
MYLITSGRVEAYRGEGESRVGLYTFRNGDVIGEMALVDDQSRPVNVRALDLTECLLITRESFNTLVKQDPEIAFCVMSVLADRVRSLSRGGEASWAAEAPGNGRTAYPEWGRAETHANPVEQTVRALEDSVDEMMQVQRAVFRAGMNWWRGWVGLWGSFLGGLVNETRQAQRNMMSRGGPLT